MSLAIDDAPSASRTSTTSTNDSRAADDAALVAAAQARIAQVACQPLDPAQRAVEGFRAAASTRAPDGAGVDAQVRADAGANARTALERSDLSPAQAKQVRQVIEHLGNAIVDGRIDPHINNTFRAHLYDLATADPLEGGKFQGALAQMTRAAEVLDRVQLAPGTRLGYDVGARQPTGRTGLPLLDVPDIDADLYFRTADGTSHIESVKVGSSTLAATAKDAGASPAARTQLGRQGLWRAAGTPQEPRSLGLFVLDKHSDFTALTAGKNLDQLQAAVGDADARRVVIGDRAYSVNELRAMGRDAVAEARPNVDAFRAQWEAKNPGARFSPIEYFKANSSTPDQVMARVGKQYGEPQPPLSELPRPTAPGAGRTAAGGGAAGAAVSAGITIVSLARNGQLDMQHAGVVAGEAARGGAIGTAAALGERAIAPTVDRAIGAAAQRAGTAVAARVGTSAVADTAAAGVAARTLATRVVGSTAVGVVVSAGVSAWDNRAGLAHGDSKAIGNVAADTAVGAASVASSVAIGAAVGSVVPVAGTAVGAAVGLVVGVGVAYGAQISGARDAIAGAASSAVDEIKSWF
ncbi:hypothetical protein [Scleromatobacter humisilvae]|uniref:Uncharacterized protein n=1 Tax=Scleromatobacter humisilvae TaxID=2897159 RepID=A0A9X2C1F9_9BURK|nr:hypothetical protein [Scleromatobacter humisilvae]MCK9687511.1 hypothetical protein [Scleromatobacter humisilvae]